MGLSDSRMEQLLKAASGGDGRRQVLSVVRHSRRSACGPGGQQHLLQEGDLIVEVCGKIVTTFGDVEAAVAEYAADSATGDSQTIPVTLVRDKEERTVNACLFDVPCKGTSRMVVLGGLVCQHHHRAVERPGFVPEGGSKVYCSFFFYGSPAEKYGLRPRRWLVALNGEPTPDLDSLLEVNAPSRSSF